MEITTIKLDKDLKKEFETKFKELYKSSPSTSEYVESMLQERIDEMDKELALRAKKGIK